MKPIRNIAVVVATFAAGCLALREFTASPEPGAGESGDTHSLASPPREAASTGHAPETGPVQTNEIPPPQPAAAPEAGDARLVAKLGLRTGEPSSVADQLAGYSVEELDLFAQVQRVTGKDPSPALREIIEIRRSGASVTDLEHAIAKELAGDTLARAAAFRWLERYGTGQGPTVSPPPRAGHSTRSGPLVAPISPRSP